MNPCRLGCLAAKPIRCLSQFVSEGDRRQGLAKLRRSEGNGLLAASFEQVGYEQQVGRHAATISSWSELFNYVLTTMC
jgi:hypothetical protein